MKKNLLFLFAVLLSLLPQAMKADTWSFEWNTSKANGGQGFYNFGASRVEKDVYTTELNGVQWNASAEGTFIYAYTSKMGQYIGSAGEPPTSAKLWTDGILGKVTAVRVTARVQKAEYEGNVSVTVNGVNYACDGKTTAALESTEKHFEFSIAAADAKEGEVAIVLNQTSEKKGPLYVRKIEIDYEKAQSTVLPPVFTPAAGTYDEAQTVEINSEARTDVIRTIYYTTDGSNPKLEGGTRVAYTEPITVAATTTLKAVVKEGKEYSDVVEAKYVINEPLKADFTTDRAFTAFYDQEFDSEEGMADWTVGEGWELANRNFKSVKADDVSSVSIAYNAQNNGTSQLTSPEFTIEEGSNVEFYAYFQAPFLIYGKWTFDVIDTESNETTTLLNAFDWAQDNGYTGPNWNKFSYSLAAFTGKKVKFEFNYPFGGENLAIDGFRLTKEDASAAETIHIFEGEKIQFVSLAKGSPDATEWKFPGSASETSTDPNPTVTYNKAGTYDVSLTVRRGNESDVMERKGFVVVAQKAPTALIGLPEEGYESPWVGVFVPTDVPVTFRDLSTGNPTEWNWVFQYADKETSNEQNPTVTFVKKGTVSVGLTAKNAAGQSNDVLQYAIQAGGSQYVWNISSEENSNLKKVELGWFGSYAGSNWLGLDRFAEKYKAPLADATINEVAVYFASVTSIDPDYEVRLTLNAVGENGEPGEELASTSVKASDLKYSDDDYLATTFAFAEPVSMEKGKEFFVVVGPFPNGTMEESPYTSDDISIFCLRRNAGMKTTAWQLVEDTDENDNGLGTYTWFANTDDPTSIAIAPCVTYKDTATSIGVTTPATDAEATVTAVYSISGQRVNVPVRGGMYIMRYSDGTCRKVMWK
ncbi:chitobiase/beta-hexosaminidase C-terminal domain-containing protein [Prevotella sp. 885]|uniref:chitobiase/beta-hexosaminidase C-terminal domain-containing protein n=1 Tax=Prevotella sp. 885 TaxID=2022527 RepID=UPI001595DA0E|nr:chitobiase/beta-hexosaminidase C-terminal domain-containing protein [Prevotella sp. 885]